MLTIECHHHCERPFLGSELLRHGLDPARAELVDGARSAALIADYDQRPRQTRGLDKVRKRLGSAAGHNCRRWNSSSVAGWLAPGV